MADTNDDADSSRSESELNEVFSELTRADLIESLSEIFENYSQIRLKYKKL